MFALSFSFPAGRYHATPWGRHVNEADISWPPEPWRILRAFIACYWRKGDKRRWSVDMLARLIDALAEDAPVFYLPPGAIHAHSRHFMPSPQKTTLVFDAFAHLPQGEELIVAWPNLGLSNDLYELASDLAEGIGYLGRAESWVECKTLSAWDSSKANCRPVDHNTVATGDLVRVLAPRSASDYRQNVFD